MRIVIDTNCLIAALIRDGAARRILFYSRFSFFSPEFTLDEIDKHISEIIEKSGIESHELHKLLENLMKRITIIPQSVYDSWMNKAEEIIGKIDIHDVPFVAVSLSLPNEGIWSDDSHFTEQKQISVWRTSDLLLYMQSEFSREQKPL